MGVQTVLEFTVSLIL